MALNRRSEILNLIREDGHAKVQKLAEIFGVSEVTIRQFVDTVISDDNVPESYRLKLKELGVGLL